MTNNTNTAAAHATPTTIAGWTEHLSWILDRQDLTSDERLAALSMARTTIERTPWRSRDAAADLAGAYTAEIGRLQSAGADELRGLESIVTTGKARLTSR